MAKMIKPKVSIIVPVYKAEKYINCCIDSILAQTYTDWELLLVDDGSPDRSGEICDEYAKKDNRIRVFHKKNEGVSSARQRGQDEAVGEYTIHVDPDDWVEPTMLEELYAKAKAEDADMVICDYYADKGGTQQYVRQMPSKMDNNTVLSELFQQLHGSCCNKLVKRVCYSGKVRFPKGINCCEDLIWCVQTLMLCSKICYINKAFYHYVMTSSSDSQSKAISKERSIEDVKMLHVLGDLLKEKKSIQKMMYINTVPYVMKRAMKAQCFDSVYFKNNFRQFAIYIVPSKRHSFLLRVVCFWSAMGFYNCCKPIIRFMK